MNKRIDAISQLIKPESVVADIGSDHAFLAINLLSKYHIRHVYNVELNRLPYENTISNLRKHNLLECTTNIIADGLQTNEINETLDVCVISGMGGLNMIKIIDNANPNIKIKQFILVPNNNINKLKAYVSEKNYKIIYETNIMDHKYSYPLIQIEKK
jgi:tRNA (adenine22-N1)-methyltransferase